MAPCPPVLTVLLYRLYDQALKMVPRHVDSWVARYCAGVILQHMLHTVIDRDYHSLPSHI